MGSSAPPLRPEQFERYRRHLSLPEFGVEGQRELLEGSDLLIGAGGLGCPLAQYLGAAGRLGFADVASLAAGIEAWSLTVDPEVPRY